MTAAKTSKKPLLLALAALVFSGTMQAVISPPASQLWLHVFSWVPALWVFSKLRGKRAFFAGWLTGVSANVAIFWWIIHTIEVFTTFPTICAYLLLLLFALGFGLYTAFFAWGFAAVRRRAGRFWPLAIPAWFVACEFLYPQLFPYYQGVAWYQVPELFLVTTVTGVPGVSYLVLAINAVILMAVESFFSGKAGARGKTVALNAGIVAGLVGVAVLISMVRLATIDAAEKNGERSIRVALLQSNFSVFHEAQYDEEYGKDASVEIAKLYAGMAAHAWMEQQGDIDVFVWGEGALDREPSRFSTFEQLVTSTDAEIWCGASGQSEKAGGGVHHHNSGFLLKESPAPTRAGVEESQYDKIVLLPFGEYIPGEKSLAFLGDLLPTGRFAPGTEQRLMPSTRAPFVFLICYEATINSFVRESLALDPDLFVNITYDHWFGDTACPHQHLMLSAIQCAQYGLPMVRSATTGISAFVDTRGIITDQTPILEPAILVRDIKLVKLPTIYGTVGDTFAWLAVLASATILLLAWRQRPSR